ncbi:MAG TPA: penicillin-binding protein 2 [Bacteroidales bacterium]|nr:penicillin-binding protein 2 [Bacteroidales bacterium]HOR81907.1 penicillin-binding protein 2 [Bacteroidales bacterium]HPJ91139.1 penicillin-binding protein 2 [Bacteroidales bacterium]HQB19901.1 penicillin-binding protein 2 [Bacteroidales bacterium]
MKDSSRYQYRKWIILLSVILVSVVYIIRLLFLQIIDDQWEIRAKGNALRYVCDYPPRGLIYDRNGELLVTNTISYDLMVVPRNVKLTETLIKELCHILQISEEEFMKRFDKAKAYSPYIESIFDRQITDETHGYIEERLHRLQGFYLQPRTLRKYLTSSAAHSLGYIGEVNYYEIEKNPYYKMGDYIGKIGIEKYYEEELRGTKGCQILMVDNLNREKGSFQNGMFDTAAIVGKSLWASLDKELQEYGELLMKNKRGSIVAIEPSTGEILCIVTSPSYDPALLVGRNRGKNYAILEKDSINKPLFNRALMAQYPPGSTFKLVNALIGQEEGVINKDTRFSCTMGFAYGNRVLGCHAHASPLAMVASIQTSCNAYYCRVLKAILENRKKYKSTKEAYDAWYQKIISFGFGQKFNSDLPYELKGNIPTSAYYDRYYGENRWKATTIISIAIGQGEITVTPVQLANFVAIIANRGYYYPPHLVKAIGHKDSLNTQFYTKHYVDVKPAYFDPVIEGMEKAATAGTVRSASVPGIKIGGKTGTAQNPHGKDHSILIGYAPLDNPKIAISVIVENAGFGATWAGPITSLMIEKYLKDSVSRKELEERIINTNIY